MKFTPSFEEIQKIAAAGDYKAVPVSCEMLSDICTPIEALRILKNVSTHCYLLESVVEKEKWGRYTFLGYDPKLAINCLDGEMKIGDVTLHTENPSEKLREILSAYKARDCQGFLHLPAGSSDTFPMIIWAIANRRSV